MNTTANIEKKIQSDPAKEKNSSLDKTAQLSTFKKTFTNRARAKYLTNAYTHKLSALNSSLKNSYQRTFYKCTNILVQKDDKLTTRYCNNRWCIVCNRIRTSKMIMGYKPELEKLDDKYFVTLTIPNVNSVDLKDTMQQMIKTFARIRKTVWKRSKSLLGIRKLECTYNDQKDNFHPHFHFIVSGKQTAECLINDWLKHYPKASIKAQDMRQADDNSIMELFKYFTKIVTNNKVHIKALDIMFRAMRNIRTFQPFGITKNISEDIEEIRAEIYADLEQRETYWNWIDTDWYDIKTNEQLTGYKPSESLLKLIDNIG